MELYKQSDGTCMEIKIIGRLDTMTSPQLEKQLQESLSQETALIFDLKELEYISSAGLRVVLSYGKIMDKQGGALSLMNVNDEVYEVFEMTGLCDLFEFI